MSAAEVVDHKHAQSRSWFTHFKRGMLIFFSMWLWMFHEQFCRDITGHKTPSYLWTVCAKNQSQSTGKWASPTAVSLTAHTVSCTFYELANTYGLNTKFRTSLSVPENWVALPVRVALVATYSYQCVQCFRVAKQRYGCQSLGFLRCAQMSLLMHSVHHKSLHCNLTLGEKSLAAPGTRIASVSCWALLSNVLPTELSSPFRKVLEEQLSNSFGPIFPESCAEVASERKKGQNVHVMNLFLGDAMQCECKESFFGDAHSGIIHYLYCKQLSCGLLKVQSNCTLRYVL